MKNKVRKYSFDNIERLSGIEFKWAMAASALLVLLSWGFIEAEGSPFGELTITFLAVFSWWAFRQYFVNVGDKKTALLLLVIILTLALAGFANVVFSIVFDLDFLLSIGSPHYLLDFFRFMAWLIIISSAIIFIGCFRIIWINRQHSFPLKRIAISAALCVPLYLLVNAVSTISFIGQAVTKLNEIDNAMNQANVYTNGQDLHQGFFEVSMAQDRQMAKQMLGDIFGIFSFLFTPFIYAYKFLIAIPYIFLFFHFYKADKTNKKKRITT